MPSSGSKKSGKLRQANRSTQPGAVSQPPVEEPGSLARPSTSRDRKSSADEKSSAPRIARATAPGAVSVAMEEPEAAMTTAKTSRRTAPAAAAVAVQEPEAATSAVSKKSGPSSKKSRRKKAATVPGAVNVAGDDDDEEGPQEPTARATTARKSGPSAKPKDPTKTKKRRGVAATAPGAVSVVDEEEPTLVDEETGKPRRSTRATTTAVATHGMSKPARVSAGTAVIPGAVAEAVEDGQDETSGARSESRNMRKSARNLGASAPGAISSSEAAAFHIAEEDAMAKKSDGKTSCLPGAQTMTGPEAEEQDAAVRRKDPRANARRKARKATAAGAAAAAGTAAAAGNEEQTREERMEAKILQMERDHGREPQDSDLPQDEDISKELYLKDADAVEKGGPSDSTTTAARGVAGAPGVEYGSAYGGIDDDALAVAVAVEEEDDVFLPAALEYDPDSKPPLYKNRRFRLYASAGSLLLIVIIVGVSVGVASSGGDSGPTAPPTPMPTSALEGDYMKQFSTVADDKVYTEGTPHNKAARWIIDEDPMNLDPNAPSLIQRFTLALLYYQTTKNGELKWRSCNPPTGFEDDTCQYQQFVRQPDDSVKFVPEESRRWLSGAHECDWAGNFCDAVDVSRKIEIWGQNLTGPLPTELVSLPYIQIISFPFNEFTGTLPSEYASMRHLIGLEVHYNLLTGKIPDQYWDATNLQVFNVGNNLMDGGLSPDLVKLSKLKGIHTFNNMFDGDFPGAEIGTLTSLAYSRNDENSYTGTFPAELGKNTLLKLLWMHENELTGEIPSELGLLTDMGDLRLAGNKMKGTIPTELYSFSNIFRIDISDMGLTGSLSTLIGQLTTMNQFKCRNNELTGTIPTELGSIKTLTLAWLHLNLMEGSMPREVCENRGRTTLQFLQTDCDPEFAPPVECDRDCCTACCDRSNPIGLCIVTGAI